MLLRLALRNLLRNVRRTVALVLTVAIGTGSLFVFHGFNNGIMNQYRDNTVHARFGHGQIQTLGYGDRVYERPWEHWIEQPQVLRSELLAIPGVRQVFPRVEFPALLSNGRVTVSGKGQGVDGPKSFNSSTPSISSPAATFPVSRMASCWGWEWRAGWA